MAVQIFRKIAKTKKEEIREDIRSIQLAIQFYGFSGEFSADKSYQLIRKKSKELNKLFDEGKYQRLISRLIEITNYLQTDKLMQAETKLNEGVAVSDMEVPKKLSNSINDVIEHLKNMEV